MLSKKNRLTKDKEFDNAFKNGKGSYSKAIGIKAVKNDLDVIRLGIMVGLKVSKKAVERNGIKRKLREIIRLELSKFKPGYDLVAIAQPGVKNLAYKDLQEEVLFHLKKMRLYKN